MIQKAEGHEGLKEYLLYIEMWQYETFKQSKWLDMKLLGHIHYSKALASFIHSPSYSHDGLNWARKIFG